MKELLDPVVADRLAGIQARFLRVKGNGEVALRRVSGWFAEPLPSGTHLSAETQPRILSFCVEEPNARLWAVPIKDYENTSGVFAVHPDPQDLREFNRTLSFLEYSLIATNGDATTVLWILACSPDEYLIAFGPEQALARLAGQNLPDAFASFAKYAADPEWPVEVRDLLLTVEAVLLKYLDAAPGTEVVTSDLFTG
jgi:hypothetical protein